MGLKVGNSVYLMREAACPVVLVHLECLAVGRAVDAIDDMAVKVQLEYSRNQDENETAEPSVPKPDTDTWGSFEDLSDSCNRRTLEKGTAGRVSSEHRMLSVVAVAALDASAYRTKDELGQAGKAEGGGIVGEPGDHLDMEPLVLLQVFETGDNLP